ncbi:MAG: hypothetical protein ACRCXT_05590 [Paraclostridium sp.]
MNKLLITLDADIKRCEEVLKLNDYLELVIVLEEIIDKYKDNIEGISIKNDRVWNYSKKDLENILEKLRGKREDIIKEYIQSQVEKTNTIDDIYYNLISEVENSKHIICSKKNDILSIIENIYNIGKEDTDLNSKWYSLKNYVNKASEEDLYTASKILSFINEIIK